eukprot:jgi/Botrbrau1/22082/Bobra.0206s0010.1
MSMDVPSTGTPGKFSWIPCRDGKHVALTTLGGTGDVLFVLHATGFCGKIYETLAESMGSEFISYAVEARGQGFSPPAPAESGPYYATHEAAWDLLAAVDALGVQGNCYAFGHSMGGVAALRAEAARPGTFKAIYAFEGVIGDPSSLPGNIKSNQISIPQVGAAQKRRQQFPSRATVNNMFRDRIPFKTWHPACFKAYVQHGFKALPDGTVELLCPPEAEAASYRAMVEPEFAQSTWDGLKRLACPVVVAWGDDPNSGFKLAELFGPAASERVPLGRFERYHGLGHLAPMEEPRFIASRILAMKKAAASPDVWLATPQHQEFDVRHSSL